MFQGIKFYVRTGDSDTAEDTRRIISALGGKVLKTLTPYVTYAIMDLKTPFEIYERAKEMEKVIIRAEWVQECQAANAKVQEDGFLLELKDALAELKDKENQAQNNATKSDSVPMTPRRSNRFNSSTVTPAEPLGSSKKSARKSSRKSAKKSAPPVDVPTPKGESDMDVDIDAAGTESHTTAVAPSVELTVDQDSESSIFEPHDDEASEVQSILGCDSIDEILSIDTPTLFQGNMIAVKAQTPAASSGLSSSKKPKRFEKTHEKLSSPVSSKALISRLDSLPKILVTEELSGKFNDAADSEEKQSTSSTPAVQSTKAVETQPELKTQISTAEIDPAGHHQISTASTTSTAVLQEEVIHTSPAASQTACSEAKTAPAGPKKSASVAAKPSAAKNLKKRTRVDMDNTPISRQEEKEMDPSAAKRVKWSEPSVSSRLAPPSSLNRKLVKPTTLRPLSTTNPKVSQSASRPAILLNSKKRKRAELEESKPAAAAKPTTNDETAEPPAKKPKIKDSGVVVALSGFPVAERATFAGLLDALGIGLDEEISPKTTHIVVHSSMGRTKKVLAAILRRLPIIGANWIKNSYSAKKLLGTSAFDASTNFPSWKKASKTPNLFNGTAVYVDPEAQLTLGVESVRTFLIEAGAEVATEPAQAKLVISGGRHAFTLPGGLPKGTHIITEKWLLDSITSWTVQNPTLYFATPSVILQKK